MFDCKLQVSRQFYEMNGTRPGNWAILFMCDKKIQANTPVSVCNLLSNPPVIPLIKHHAFSQLHFPVPFSVMQQTAVFFFSHKPHLLFSEHEDEMLSTNRNARTQATVRALVNMHVVKCLVYFLFCYIRLSEMWHGHLCACFCVSGTEAEGAVCSGQWWRSQWAPGGRRSQLWHSRAGQSENPVELQGQVWFPLQLHPQGALCR